MTHGKKHQELLRKLKAEMRVTAGLANIASIKRVSLSKMSQRWAELVEESTIDNELLTKWFEQRETFDIHSDEFLHITLPRLVHTVDLCAEAIANAKPVVDSSDTKAVAA